jgi:sedoheptulose-bisphosphatase
MPTTTPPTTALPDDHKNGYGVASAAAISSTSFYTDAVQKDAYESLHTVLQAKCADPAVRHVIRDMLDVCAEITEALRAALVHVNGATNDFGDTQLSVDVRTYMRVR